MRFQCPICKELLSVEDSEMGSAVQCVHCGKEVQVPSSRTAPGSVIGDFIILKELGRGGMGIVYEAHQISLDRPAAVKILAESYAKNADFVVGFIKEARAAAKLNHPNIVQAYAVGDDDGIFYFAMEFINGETMKEILDKEKILPVDKAIDIVRQIAEALDYAWQEEKLVHRDIKPDNIMLTSNGRAKLADLGLAKVGNDPGKTEGEEVMGTPQYISPEQLTGDALDNRTDIYCLGGTFYQFLTGRFPYEGSSAMEIARQHLEGTLIPPHQVNPAVPEAVSNVVVKMMEKSPDQRYQSAGQLAEDLNAIKHGQKPAGTDKSGAKLSPPKITIPGKKAPAVSVKVPPKAGPKLSLSNAGKSPEPQPPAPPAQPAAVPKSPAGKGGPKLSLKSSSPAQPPVPPPVAPPQGQGAAVPAQPAQTPPPAPPAAVPVGKKAKGKKGKDKDKAPISTGKKIVMAVVGVVVLAAVALGGWAAYLQFVKKQDPLAQLKTVIDNTKENIQKATAEPEPSEFMKAAAPVIELIRKPDADQGQALRKCYEFLKTRLLPENDDEKELAVEIRDYFARNDEGAIESAREKKLEAYEAEQERKRLAAEAAAARKMEAERQARKREEERKLAEEDRRRRESEQAAEQAKKKRQLDGFNYQFTSRERKMVLELFRCSMKQDAEQLKQVFEKNIAVRDDIPKPEWLTPNEYYKVSGSLIYRAKTLQKAMENAWEWEKIFNEGHPDLIGIPIELHRNICHVTEIKDGVIHAKAGSKEFSEPIKNLVDNKKFFLFAINAGAKLKKKNTMPYYFFWIGGFRLASQIAQELPNQDKWRYSAFVTGFLKEAVKDSDIKPQLEKYFRGVPEYDRMFPSRRSTPPPAPRKNTPKKNTRKKKK